MPPKPHKIIYTDGACTGNPGPGGWAVIVTGPHEPVELSGGFSHTTNNRMELTAVIEALKTLSVPSKVDLYTDSRYIVDAIEKGWARSWKARGWRRSNKARALNADLWARVLDLLNGHEITFHWVPGHAGNPLNEQADRLAVVQTRRRDLRPDPGYRPEELQSGLF